MGSKVPFELGRLEPREWDEFAELVCVSLNFWYRSHGMGEIFPGPVAVMPFLETYEALDPGRCIVARRRDNRRLMGGCFMHPRETHVSLGIMAVHPNHFAAGVGKAIVKAITDEADRRRVPTRLISSAVNMDSLSLYTRAGFVPRKLFQDMLVTVPEGGVTGTPPVGARDAEPADVEQMASLEQELLGIRREADLRYMVSSPTLGWHVSISDGGWLASLVNEHAALIGPGVSRDWRIAAGLLQRELSRIPGRTALVLVQADQPDLVQQLYRWGGRNIETHVIQIRGDAKDISGVILPTFLPETA